ncbi:MAG: DUF2946 domain-containing protein [Pararobbsia sp.]
MVFPTRKHLSAWLGIFAMCLIVFVPVASQLLVAVRANEPLAALCSVTQPAGDGAHHAGDPLAACGYCDLLADSDGHPTGPPGIEFVALRVLTPGRRHAFHPLHAAGRLSIGTSSRPTRLASNQPLRDSKRKRRLRAAVVCTRFFCACLI